jgi:CelD/BcsL family acetyltransferase involved in cellulose biosynthesis
MIEVITNVMELANLETEWNLLAARFATPLVRHEWFATCADTYADRYRIAVFILRQGSKIQAIAPLTFTRRAAVSTLQMIGHPLSEPTSLLYADENSLRLLLEGILSRRYPIFLNRHSATSCEEKLLRQFPLKRVYHRSWQAGHSAWVPTRQDWASFEAALSSSSRNYIKRRAKQAKQAGGLDLDVVTPTEQTLATHLQTFLRIEASGWKGREGTAIILNPEMKQFITMYSEAAARRGMLRLFFLKIGGERVAGRLAIEYANRLWELKIGYDEAWRKYSPGILLTHETLRYACERNLEGLEFLGHHAPWQEMWPTRMHHYHRSCLYPINSVRSYVPLVYDTGYYLLQDIYRKVRKRV